MLNLKLSQNPKMPIKYLKVIYRRKERISFRLFRFFHELINHNFSYFNRIGLKFMVAKRIFVYNGKDVFLFDELLKVPQEFYISINPNSNSLFLKGKCNINKNTAWKRTLGGNWIPLSAPVSVGGIGIPTSYKIDPIIHKKPQTNFVANVDLAYNNEEVTFFDISKDDPETYDWTFFGIDSTKASGDVVEKKYNEEGEYDVFLKTSNVSGTDSLLKLNYIKVLEDFSMIQNTSSQLYAWEKDQVYENDREKYKAKGEYFVAGPNDDYLQGIEINIANLYLPRHDNWDKNLSIHFMSVDSVDKKPYQILDSMLVPFNYIEKAVKHQGYIRFKWSKPISLPPSFFIVVKIQYATNLKYAISYGYTNDNHDQSTAWVQLRDGTWRKFSSSNRLSNAIKVVTTAKKILSSEEENSFSQFVSLFPNPASSSLTIQSSLAITSYSIVNVVGKTIQTASISSQKNSIDITNLSNGLYFIRLNTEKGIITKRFVVK